VTTFHIKLSPQRREDRLQLEKRGSTLVLNGEVFDPTKQDYTSTASQWISGQPEPTDDGWSVTVILPHGDESPRATRFPKPIVVSDDGPVELPPYEGPDEDKEQLRIAVAKKLAEHAGREIIADATSIKIPERLKLQDMPDGVYFYETTSPLTMLPEFGAIVAHVIGTASLIEIEILRTGISLHGKQALLTLRTSYEKLPRDLDRRITFIKKVAEGTGKDEISKAVNWAFKYSEPIFNIRHSFAHRIWGECAVIPNAPLLLKPMDRLIAHAAHTQIVSDDALNQEAHTLFQIASGEGGSKLSDADTQAIFKMIAARQSHPSRVEAFDLTFGNSSSFPAPSAEIWTAGDFRNAYLAANLAYINIRSRLLQLNR